MQAELCVYWYVQGMIDFRVTCVFSFVHITTVLSHVFIVAKIDFSKYTHIQYAFALMVNGSIPIWQNPQMANAQLTKLVTMAHKHNVKVLVSCGGWTGSQTFRYMETIKHYRSYWHMYISSMAKTRKSRKEFIDWNIKVMKRYIVAFVYCLLTYTCRYKTDGVDIGK